MEAGRLGKGTRLQGAGSLLQVATEASVRDGLLAGVESSVTRDEKE